jgi:hypothetical protein
MTGLRTITVEAMEAAAQAGGAPGRQEGGRPIRSTNP